MKSNLQQIVTGFKLGKLISFVKLSNMMTKNPLYSKLLRKY